VRQGLAKAPAVLLAAATLLGGCTTSPRSRRLTAAPGERPWEVPAAAYGTQRLFRGSYSGPEGEGSVRATLRLAARGRYQLEVADRLGRVVASFQLAPEGQRAVDHRRGLYCTGLAAVTLPGLGKLPVAAEDLPAVLLGRLPAAPSGSELPAVSEVDYRDPGGRRWTGTLAAGEPTAWTLWDDAGPLWWWRAEGRGGRLSHREGRQLRWQEVVAEPLAAGALDHLGAAAPAAGYREDCEALMADGEGASP
jgi:hypothetical protein